MPSPIRANGTLKLETFQPMGAFKVRGALAAISALPEDQAVVTASAGNHGLGVGGRRQDLAGRRLSSSLSTRHLSRCTPSARIHRARRTRCQL